MGAGEKEASLADCVCVGGGGIKGLCHEIFKASLKYWIDLGLNQSNSWSLNFCMQMLLPFFIVISKIFFSFDPKKDGVPGKFSKFPMVGRVDRLFSPPSLVSRWLKGTVPRDFRLQVFFMHQFPSTSQAPKGRFKIFRPRLFKSVK